MNTLDSLLDAPTSQWVHDSKKHTITHAQSGFVIDTHTWVATDPESKERIYLTGKQSSKAAAYITE